MSLLANITDFMVAITVDYDSGRFDKGETRN
jgi:hypothetical protein